MRCKVMGCIWFKRLRVGSNRLCHVFFAKRPEKLFERHGMHGFLADSAGEGEPALACCNAELASCRTDAPTRTREESQGVQSAFAQLNLVEKDEGGLFFYGHAFVVGDARHDAVDVVGRAVEQGLDELEIGLEVEFYEGVAGNSPADGFSDMRFANAASAADQQRAAEIFRCPGFDGCFDGSSHNASH